MYLKSLSFARTLLVASSIAGIALASTPSRAQNDPLFGLARLAYLQGNVSFQPYGIDAWGQAYSNQPVGPGDRIFTDPFGRGELQTTFVRAYFSPGADLTLVNLNQLGTELGIGQGSAYIFSDGFPPGQGVSVQTPNGAVTIGSRAGFRIDVYPDQQSTVITNYNNYGALTLNGGGGFYLVLPPGESVQLAGTNPVYAQPLQGTPNDEFGHWSFALETHRFSSISARYVSVEMPGYDELDEAGDWQPESDYGPIWFPHVQAGWAPYHYGHWVNMPFYGWTWVANEPWGAAPFHYGRWVVVGGRWGWIPGPREGHPIWSPAQVVFAGGVQVGGVGVSVWFPLGPGEAYRPWYPCSPTYINQINVTNIRESRVVHVQTTYVNIVNVTNVTYINRTVGVTAMRQEDFAAGHSAETAAVKIAPQQVEHIQPARPEAKPPAQAVILRPIGKPAAAPQARPVLINSKGQQIAAAPNAKPVAVPVKVAPPAPKPLPGRTAIGSPTVGGKPVSAPAKPVVETAKPAPANQPQPNKQETAKPAAPATAAQPARPAAEAAYPAAQPAPKAQPVASPVKSSAPPAIQPEPAAAASRPAPATTAKPMPAPAPPAVKPQPASTESKPVSANSQAHPNPGKPVDKNNKKDDKKDEKKSEKAE